MTIGELMAIIQTMDPNHEALVAFFTPDGTVEEFDVDAVQDDQGGMPSSIFIRQKRPSTRRMGTAQ